LDKIVLAKQKASAYYAVLRCQNTVSDVASKLGWRFCVQQSKFALRRAPRFSPHRVRVAWDDGGFFCWCGFVRSTV